MPYFYQDGPMHGWNSAAGYRPSAPIEHVFCDACAQAGAVPFEQGRDGLLTQCRPWKWAPWAIGGDGCDKCGAGHAPGRIRRARV